MDDRQADLFADFGLAGADRFNILLIKHDVIGPCRHVKYALLGRGHAMEETQKQPPFLPRLRWLQRNRVEVRVYFFQCLKRILYPPVSRKVRIGSRVFLLIGGQRRKRNQFQRLPQLYKNELDIESFISGRYAACQHRLPEAKPVLYCPSPLMRKRLNQAEMMEACGAALCYPSLERRSLYRLGGELQRLFGRDLFAILIDVVDVPRAVARGRQCAGRDAGRLVGMLAWVIEIIASHEVLRGLAFHL